MPILHFRPKKNKQTIKQDKNISLKPESNKIRNQQLYTYVPFNFCDMILKERNVVSL